MQYVPALHVEECLCRGGHSFFPEGLDGVLGVYPDWFALGPAERVCVDEGRKEECFFSAESSSARILMSSWIVLLLLRLVICERFVNEKSSSRMSVFTASLKVLKAIITGCPSSGHFSNFSHSFSVNSL